MCQVWMMRSFFLLCHLSRDSGRFLVDETGRDSTPYEREYADMKGLNALMEILSSHDSMNPTDTPLGRDETYDYTTSV
ncbi:hypothetical protein GOP47_0013157 [Adiantum capillus-veneris]|uniref:Uncharacterized protein n=1 Tax=Adiantum capillus-veneris TaxID=13818 RepID=A0A9D4UNP5_ADICA|nr:hypothetical protein GOP47_0013157 [Adiantum capillus-veneris]